LPSSGDTVYVVVGQQVIEPLGGDAECGGRAGTVVEWHISFMLRIIINNLLF